MPIITEMKEKGNRALEKVPEGVLLLAIIALTASGSFGVGYMSGKEAGGGDIVIESRGGEVSGARTSVEQEGSSLEAAPVAARAVSSVKEEESLPPPPTGGGEYVASKSGKSYHLPWCAGAKQIKEENKIYFTSKAEAEAAGYAPAKNCKGI